MRLRYHKEALANITAILEWLEQDDHKVALRFSTRLATLADRLTRHPNIGRPTEVNDLRVIPVRPFPYLMFYMVEDEGIAILKVRHMARNEDWRQGR